MSLVPYVHVDVSLAEGEPGDAIELTEAETRHLRRVLRLPDDAEVEVADGAGNEAGARLGARELVLTTEAVYRTAAQPSLWVAQALPKGRKLDDVIRQVTELGVDGIMVIAAKHSVTRLDEVKIPRARQRWEGVARAASEQARRPWRPRIVGPRGPSDLVGEPGTLLLAHPGGAPLPEVIVDHVQAERITVAIGPEGGWSDDEVARFEEAGAILAGLGSTVLRTEHAAAAALAVTAAGVGRW